jgi:hypothetical protein
VSIDSRPAPKVIALKGERERDREGRKPQNNGVLGNKCPKTSMRKYVNFVWVRLLTVVMDI